MNHKNYSYELQASLANRQGGAPFVVHQEVQYKGEID